MLVLSRKEGESIHIYPSPDIDPNMTVQELFSQPIEIVVTQIYKGQIRIGIRRAMENETKARSPG